MISRRRLKESRLFIVFLSTLVALAPLSIDMYMPAMAQMADIFKVDFSQINLTLSAYLLGNAIGQFFGGALSDQLGRKTIGVVGLAAFFACSLAIAFINDIQTMQMLRVVQAIGGGFAAVICISQIRDVFPKHEVLKRYADVVMVMMIAPILAPTFGVFLIQFGWRSIFFVLSAISLCVLLTYTFAIPETKAVSEMSTSGTKGIDIKRLFSGYWRVINHRINGRLSAIRYALYSGFSMGVFMCVITNVGMIFMNHYHFSELHFALGFSAIGIAMIVGNRIAVKLRSTVLAKKLLLSATIGQIFCTGLLVVLSSVGALAPWLAVILIGTTVIMSGGIIPITSATFISFFDQHAGSAASLSATISSGFGAIIGAIAALLSKHSITPVFVVMILSACLALIVLASIRRDDTKQTPPPKQQHI